MQMKEIPYTTVEIERIRTHFLAIQSAMQSGEASEALMKYGLPSEYMSWAEKIARAVVQAHGISVPSAAFVIAGMTVGFAMGRDFGRSEAVPVCD